MALLLETNMPEWMTNEALEARIRPLIPDADIRYAPNYGNLDDVIMLTCVRLPADLAKQLPNLQLVQKLGAGVETMVHAPELAPDVKVARLKPDVQAQEIAEYCVAYVLRFHRNMPFHEEQQAEKIWVARAPNLTSETTVGIVGLGYIGSRTADQLQGSLR